MLAGGFCVCLVVTKCFCRLSVGHQFTNMIHAVPERCASLPEVCLLSLLPPSGSLA
jgi:hypothetical protein